MTFLVLALSVLMSGTLYMFRLYKKMVVPTDVTVVTDKNKEPNNVGDKDKVTNGDGNNSTDNKGNIKKPVEQVDEKPRQEEYITNILLIGTDDRQNGEGERADAIIILTLDEIDRSMRLTSIMRDSYVYIPESKNRDASWEKINHSYAYGGPSLLMRTIQDNFKIKLDKYVKIDFSGFKTVVQRLGGIDVKIYNREELNELNRCLLLDIYDSPKYKNKKRFRDILEREKLLDPRDEGAKYRIEDNPNVTEEEFDYIADLADFKYSTGVTHLDGRQTLAYSRMRHSTGGSMGRTSRQREVIDLLIGKLPGLNILSYFSLAEEITDYVRTNIEITEMVSLAKKAMDIGNFSIKQLQVPPEDLTEGRLYIGYYNAFVFLMDINQVKTVLHKFVFEGEEYDPDRYEDFNYRNSRYYIEPPPKPEKEEEEPEEEKSEEVPEETTEETDKQDSSQEEPPKDDSQKEETSEEEDSQESDNESQDDQSQQQDNTENSANEENSENEVDDQTQSETEDGEKDTPSESNEEEQQEKETDESESENNENQGEDSESNEDTQQSESSGETEDSENDETDQADNSDDESKDDFDLD